MENSAYVPGAGHLSSPALVVFSQAAGGLTEALRIQRPFNPQLHLTDASGKDLHRPFSATGLSLRHMEAYNSLPAHLLHHLQPQFLHPSLSLGSGAFRPLSDLKAFPSPSAFGPPKCVKIETSGDGGVLLNSHAHGHGHPMFSPNEDRLFGSQNSRTDSCSPASASLSPPPVSVAGSGPSSAPPQALNHVKEESLDAHMSEDGDGAHTPGPSCNSDADIQMHEDNRGFRLGPLFGGGAGSFTSTGAYSFSSSGPSPGPASLMPPNAHSHTLAKNNFLFEAALKKKKDPSCCPVCGMTVSPGELESHFLHELERLYKLSSTSSIKLRAESGRAELGRPGVLPGDAGPEGRWETFQRIKTNRQGRLRIKLRKRKADESCPICSSLPMGRLHRTVDDLSSAVHGDQCMRKSGNSGSNDEDETVDVEGDSEFEEWANNQRRLLTTSLAAAAAAGFNSTVTATSTSNSARSTRDGDGEPVETEDLIVDGDEPEVSSHYGPSQYTETDVVIASANDASKDQSQDGVQSQVTTSSGDVEVKVESGGQHCDSNVSTSDAEPSSRAQVLEDLKSRIRQLEAEAGSDTATSTDNNEDFKCLICLEHYKKPVISTVCWHVHCEECWLHTLGTKKMCPQCSMITTPSDLRRIFM